MENQDCIYLGKVLKPFSYKGELKIYIKDFYIDQINELTKLNSKILCITHDISMISEIYNRVIMLKERMIIADGTQNETINNKNINNLFDINVDVLKHKGSWHVYRKPK